MSYCLCFEPEKVNFILRFKGKKIIVDLHFSLVFSCFKLIHVDLASFLASIVSTIVQFVLPLGQIRWVML